MDPKNASWYETDRKIDTAMHKLDLGPKFIYKWKKTLASLMRILREILKWLVYLFSR